MNKNIRFTDKDGNSLLPIPCNLIKTTYAKLKALRDAGSLVKGMSYRITDYQCTTTQENTQSANHQFDIIVTATSESTLSESARAMLHDGDTYFAKCNLQAWRINYCLDNDTDRFVWADAENGKGVVYRLVDEYANDLPYDFKNIMFKRSYTTLGGKGNYLGIPGQKVYFDKDANNLLPGQDDTNTIFCYTFSCLASTTEDGANKPQQADASVGLFVTSAAKKSDSIRPHSNTFESRFGYMTKEDGSTVLTRGLPYITFQQLKSADNAFIVSGNYFSRACHDLSFNCNNVFLNKFTGTAANISFLDDVYRNTVNGYLYQSTFMSTLAMNDINGDLREATFQSSAVNNDFSGSTRNLSVGKAVKYNVFSGEINGVTSTGTFENSTFSGNIFGMTFGDDVMNNTFGGNFENVFFDSGVSNSTLSGKLNESEFYGPVNHCRFEGLCSCFNFPGTSESPLQYIRVTGAVDLAELDVKEPTIATGVTYEQTITVSKSGSVVVKYV